MKTPTATAGKPRVLIADDNPLDRKWITYLMDGWNYDLHIVENGSAAIDELAAQEYALILMDVYMPGIDGLETSRRIRKQLHKATPIIAMSASLNGQLPLQCQEIGMNEFIRKPFDPIELFDKMAMLVEQPEA